VGRVSPCVKSTAHRQNQTQTVPGNGASRHSSERWNPAKIFNPRSGQNQCCLAAPVIFNKLDASVRWNDEAGGTKMRGSSGIHPVQ
jgi:hypothetical protein